MVADPMFHARSKHIELDILFVSDKVLQQALFICYIPSLEQVVDIFTKHISSLLFFMF